MRNALAISRKELSIYFTTPIAYAMFGGMTFIAGMMFLAALGYFQEISMRYMSARQPEVLERLNLTDMVTTPLLMNIGVIFLFICPFLAMRLVAEEKRNKTFELLMTTPVRPWEIMLGKFLSAVGLMLVAVGLLAIFPLLVSAFGSGGTFLNSGASNGSVLDWQTVLSGLLGLFLVGASMMAIGMFVSSLTESVVLAAFATFVILLVLWILGWQAGRMEGFGKSLLEFISMPGHLTAFVKGAPALKDFCYFLSFLIFFPFLTERAIEAQRWG